jgi:hypothetical protein
VKESAIDKKKMDDAMRKEIVEYLLKGIREALDSSADPKRDREQIEEDGNLFGAFLGKIKQLFTRDEQEDADSLRDSILGEYKRNNPNIRKVNLTERKSIMREAIREKAFKLPLDNQKIDDEFILDRYVAQNFGDGIRFVSLGQKIFQNLRILHNIADTDIKNLFSIKNLNAGKLKVKLQSGKGGAFFVKPEEGKFLLKSINEEEYEVVKTILADLYMHYLTYDNSYINPIYGCYALYLSEGNEIEP